jgi:4'-phosphopantetheinyl transferase
MRLAAKRLDVRFGNVFAGQTIVSPGGIDAPFRERHCHRPCGPTRPPGFIDMHTRVTVDNLRLDADPFRIEMLTALLSKDECARADRFRFADDRRRFIVARGRLRQLLGAELGVDPRALALQYGAHGKPFLAERFAAARLQFNVAHSGEIAVIALTVGHHVGVDVEALRELDDAGDIVAGYFSQREQQEYDDVRPEDKAAAFFNGWTRKEAVTKALGTGLSLPLDCFDVSLAPGKPACLRRLRDKAGSACGWHLHSFSPAIGYIAAIAVEGSQSECEVHLHEPGIACDERRPPHG